MSNQEKIIEDPEENNEKQEETQIDTKILQPSKQIIIKKPNSSTFNQSFLLNSLKNQDENLFSMINLLLTKENKDFLNKIPIFSKTKKENSQKDKVIVIKTSKSSKNLLNLMIFNKKEEENLKKHTEKLNFQIEILKKELKYDGFIKENLQKKAIKMKIKELSEISKYNMKRISLLTHDNQRMESQIKKENKSEQRRKFQFDFEKEKENANQKLENWKKSRIDLEKKANIRKAIIELENEDKMNKEKEEKKEEIQRKQKEINEKREKYIRKMKEIHNEILNIKEERNKSIDDIRLIKSRKYKYQLMNEQFDTKETKEKQLYDEKIKKVKSSKKKKVPNQEEFDDFYSKINIKKTEFDEKRTKKNEEKMRNSYANHVEDVNDSLHEKSVFYIRLEEESLKIKSEENEKETKKKENSSKKKNFSKSIQSPKPDERKRKEMKEMKKSHIGMHIMNRNHKQNKGNSQFNRMKKRMIRFSNKIKADLKRKEKEEKEEKEKTSIDISNIVAKTKTDMENNMKSIVKTMNFSSIHTNQRLISRDNENSNNSNNKIMRRSIEIRKPMKKYPDYLVEMRKLTKSKNEFSESRFLIDKLSKISKISKEGKEGKAFTNSNDHTNSHTNTNIYDEYFKLKNEIEDLEEKTSKKMKVMKVMKEMKGVSNKGKDYQYEILKSRNDLSDFFSFQIKKKFRLLKLMSNVK